MALRKRVYTDEETIITAENLNDIQDAILELEDGLFSIDNNKSGEIIAITDAAKRGFRSLNIYGRTTQNGTPTPEAPVELDRAGDSGSIGVTVAGKNIFKYGGKAQVENGSVIDSSASGGTFQGNPGDNPGSTAWSSGWAHLDRANPLHLKQGTVITVSADYTVLEKHSSAKDKISILLNNHSGPSSLDIRNAEIGVKYRIGRTLTIPEDGEYKRTTFTTHSSKVRIENVQWEIGLSASDFAPYRENTFSVSTPNGLPGIPVSSGGNYTDANGQPWICDEIDLTRGVYVQRTHIKTFDGTEKWNTATSENDKYFSIYHSILGSSGDGLPKSSHFVQLKTGNSGYFFTGSVGFGFYHTSADVNEWKAFLAEQYANGTPVELAYILANPIETPLSEEELAAYASLHTYRGNTTVANDANAWMDLEYVMDAKSYIDRLVITAGSTARLANITLLASAWTTQADGLHSQVVSVPGVTEYSKVDLLPSVEQLAIFHNKDVAFVTENEDGVVTVFAIGDKPILDYTMQAQITEVVV